MLHVEHTVVNVWKSTNFAHVREVLRAASFRSSILSVTAETCWTGSRGARNEAAAPVA